MTHFISGHLSLTKDEFDQHYKPHIDKAIKRGDSFVVGDAKGADKMAQEYLLGKTDNVTVYHMITRPRNNAGFKTKGGYKSDRERDIAMTNNSDNDIAWVRPGRELSGTQQNLNRRKK